MMIIKKKEYNKILKKLRNYNEIESENTILHRKVEMLYQKIKGCQKEIEKYEKDNKRLEDEMIEEDKKVQYAVKKIEGIMERGRVFRSCKIF